MTRLSKDLERLIEEKSGAYSDLMVEKDAGKPMAATLVRALLTVGHTDGMRAGFRLGVEKAAEIADEEGRGGGIRDVTAHNLAIDILALVKDHDEVEARD